MSKSYLQVGTIKKAMDKVDGAGNTIKGKLYINLNQVTDKTGTYHSENLVELVNTLTSFIETPEKGGVNLQIRKPQEKLQNLLETGHITEEQYESRLAKVPDWIKYEISLVTE